MCKPLSDISFKQSVNFLSSPLMCHRFHFDAAAQRSFKGHIGLISQMWVVKNANRCYHSTVVFMVVISISNNRVMDPLIFSW